MLRNKIEINLLSRLNMSWLSLEYKPQVMQRINSWKLQEHKHLLTPLRVELELYQYVENCWIEQRFDFVQSQQLSQCMQQQQHQCCLMEIHWNFDVWLWNRSHLRAAKMIWWYPLALQEICFVYTLLLVERQAKPSQHMMNLPYCLILLVYPSNQYI